MLAETRGGPQPLSRTSTCKIFNMEEIRFSLSAASVSIDFLMPNGIIIQHEVSTSAPLAEIKAEVWEKASEYPLFGLLHDQTAYHFVCIQIASETMELMDESQCLQEINLFMNVLKVVERIGNEEEKLLNIRIGHLIGKGLKEFDALKNPEVNDFRWKMRNECDEVVRGRNKRPWESQVLYLHPCHLAPSSELPQYIVDKMPNKQIYFSVRFPKAEDVEPKFTIWLPHDNQPSTLLELAFRKRLKTYDPDPLCKTLAQDHILKILGHEEYLLIESPLSQYISIRNHICQRQIEREPFELFVVRKEDIDVEIDSIYGSLMESNSRPTRTSISASTLNKKKSMNFVSSWNINEPLKIKIGSLSKVNVESEEVSKVVVEAGLYHAGNPLCQNAFTHAMTVQRGYAKVERELAFPIPVCNLPRSTRLCLAVYEVTPSSVKAKGRPPGEQVEIKKPMAWVNTSVYDYRGHLKGGAMTLYCWSSLDEQLSELVFPYSLGTVVSNPNHERALSITVTFTKYLGSTTVVFPSKEVILASAKKNAATDEQIPTEQDQKEFLQIADRDPLTEFHEQERKKLWTYRRFCMRNIPHILSKLLQCVEWDSPDEVAEMLALLEEWPKLSVDRALELLDYAYAEPSVRSFAIDCLSYMSDDDLLLYLLQLVQALKHESYLCCDLVQFLLQRALMNRRIGHFLFWYLRSEMHVSSVSIRFGLILEAYCRGSVEHMKLLQKQVDAFCKFKNLQNKVREHRGIREKAICSLRESLQQDHSVKLALSNFLNPIEPTFRISSVRAEKCKSMDSKMQPLWLVFDNSDPHGKDIFLLYKKGDDIRQDMLTLQMIRIMDKLWKDHGLDLRLNPYRCLSTADKEGIIEIVNNAQTIANIQRQKGTFSATSPFRKRSLFDWLRDHNTSVKSLDNAVHEFTLSCAGYSVATYVLGIADRHNDNIMIMPNGQLFHIDFGHILGHFKEKFGIRRERQPFVLTHDFIYVIQKGSNSKTKSFEKFKNCCEEAFMLLRRYGSFIISLFAMMISTGLPELQSEKDLDYLKETLKLNLNDEEARNHFRSKFEEALVNAWKTSLNWAVHSMAKNNR